MDVISALKTVIITGASSGIGFELSKILCKRGYKVLGIGRNEKFLKRLKAELEDMFDYIAIDLINRESIGRIINYVSRHLKHVNILINNAGYGINKELIRHDIDEIEHIFIVNTIRPLQLINALIEYMDRGSTIVNVVTLAIYTLSLSLPSYAASKIALHYASMVLEKELENKGINVIRVYLGPVKTRFFERAGMRPPKRFILEPNKVAIAIVDAIEKQKKRVIIPWYLGILSFISKCPISISF